MTKRTVTEPGRACPDGAPMEIRGKSFDGERALYGLHGMRLSGVTFGARRMASPR